MLYIKIFLKEELKFSKQGLDNSNTEIVKSLEKELEFLKQELVNKNKLIEMYTSKILGNSKDNSNGNDFDLDTELSTLNSKFLMKPSIAAAMY